MFIGGNKVKILSARRRLTVAAAALTLCFGLSACNQAEQTVQTTGQQQPVADGGGYGPFGAETPPTNAPQTGGQQPFQPTGQPTGAAGVEGVISGAGGNVPANFQSFISNTLDNYAHSMVPNWSRVQSVPDVVTSLQQGGEHAAQVSLRGGQHYAFLGACDNDCDNVDLILQDASGAVVDSDALTDDYPAVDVRPPADAIYTVRLQLRTCTNAPCYVGIRLLRE